jgi:hypothetical protein
MFTRWMMTLPVSRDSNPAAIGPSEIERRSRRLYLHIPLRLDWQPENQARVSEEAETVVVNAHGALVRLDLVPTLGQKLSLQNKSANQTQDAIVVFVGKEAAKDGKFSVGIEFIQPNASFWRITFPPEDWSLKHPDAKK